MGPDLVLPLRTSEIAIDNDDEAIAYWHETYGYRAVTAPLAPGAVLRHSMTRAGSFALCEVEVPAGFTYYLDPLEVHVAAAVRAGRIDFGSESHPRSAAAGDVVLTADPDASRWGRSDGAIVQLTLIHPSLLQRVAGYPDDSRETGAIRFTHWMPVSDAAAAQFNVTRLFVAGLTRAPTSIATPLVLGQAARLLGAAFLATFPNNSLKGPSAQDSMDAGTESLRRAMAFIEDRAADNVGISDIASAARVSPRAVQLAFRRHLSLTPTAYLRLVRLHHVHDELKTATPEVATVGAVARRWGFAHAGRFGVLYRETFGESPSRTLRRQ